MAYQESSRRSGKGTSTSASNARSVQQPIPIPRDYVPISPPLGDERYRGRSSSRLNRVKFRPPQSTGASAYIPSSNYYPSSKSHGYDDRHSSGSRVDDRYRRSSSQQPRGSDLYRPTYSRQRSHSYDSPSFRHPSRTSAPTRSHGVSSQVPAASETIRASETLPTFIHPSDKQPLIVPISDGRNGWVVVSANRQEVRIIDPSGSETIHPLAKPRKQGSRFFGGFKFGSKDHSKTRSGKPEYRSHERDRTAKPVTQAIINPFRRRRDSY